MTKKKSTKTSKPKKKRVKPKETNVEFPSYTVEDFLEGRVPRFEGKLDVFHLKVPKKFNLREVAYDLE